MQCEALSCFVCVQSIITQNCCRLREECFRWNGKCIQSDESHITTCFLTWISFQCLCTYFECFLMNSRTPITSLPLTGTSQNRWQRWLWARKQQPRKLSWSCFHGISLYSITTKHLVIYSCHICVCDDEELSVNIEIWYKL